MWLTDGPTNGLTGVDAYGSKKWKYAMKIDTCDYWRPKVNKFYSVWSNCLSTGQWWWDKLKTITLVSTKQMSKSWGRQINAINVTMHLLIQAIWGAIWKHTVEKSQTNATNVTLPLLRQAIWGDIWKHTVEKSQTNATNVTLHPLMQALWGHIWKRTVEKSQTNATNVTLHPLRQAIWGHIWKHTVEKSQTNAINVTLPLLR